MRVLLSTGIGRLHLIKSARAILCKNVDLCCIQGWVPKCVDNNLLIRLICYVLRRKSITNGLKERIIPELKNRIYACAFSEFFVNALFILSDKLKLISRDKAAMMGWKSFGRQSKKYLKGFDILHVRSGAGQGGLIKLAHKKGMKVLVDQSIAHPMYMDDYLYKEFENNKSANSIGAKSLFWQLVLKDCLEADLLLVNSAFVKDTFVENGYPAGKIRVVYCGLSSSFKGLKKNYEISSTIKILFTGYFGIRKGAEYVLKALRELDRLGIKYQMIVVGFYDQTLIDKYENPNVILNGHIPQEQLTTYLSDSDMYLFPSLVEGCANSGMEALGAGIPVIATKESGLPLKNGENSLVVRAKNVPDIVESILLLSNNLNLRERLGKTASMQMKDYTWERYAEEVISIYEELLS